MTQPRLLGSRYELDGVVGRGGMAEVYRARDVRLDRTVAIKTLRSDLARDPTFQARFRREAQSAASLNHPSIIAVYDTGEDVVNGTAVPYIVMEYVDGRTLRELLRADRRLLPERALEIVDGILRALDYSHKGGIIHRDIKPANVMLTRSGDVKVMDFGIARAMADSAATMTQTAQVIGTAQYLSPEQARGERVDARSDLYSTGCVLYELLTGHPPFTGDSPVAIAYQHVREDPVPPSQVDPEIPRWADGIVLKAMAKDANDRYQSASDFRADIQRALSGMPVDAATMAMASTRRSPAAGGPATQRTTAIPPYEYGPEQRGYDPYERPRDPNRGWKIAAWILIPLLIIAAFAAIGYLFLGSGGGGGGDKVRVPSVDGQTVENAKRTIEGAGLTTQIKKEKSDTVEKDTVIRTEPGANEEVAKGSLVTIVASDGKPLVKVPDVRNQKVETAKPQLEAAGFVVTTKSVPSAKTEGTVVAQDPAGGKEVPQGSEVKLSVAAAREEVPDLKGQTKADAIRALEEAGFKTRVTERFSDDIEEGLVVGTLPPAKTKLPQGATVTVIVSKGPKPDPTPTPSVTPTGG